MDLNFIPPGPVSSAFFFDRSPVAGLMGPMGSAKTSTCIMKMARIAAEMPVSKVTGERLCKFGVVRNTFADLKRTTMKSIDQWFQNAGQWGGGGSSSEPPYFKVGFRLPDMTIARLWLDFVGLDTHNIEQLAKGWELSWYWMNEMDLMPRDVKDMLDGRVGRYPGAAHVDIGNFYGGFGDYNAPDTENWTYKLFEEEKPSGHRLFKQPSGLDPKAENIQNLPEGYYQRMMVGKEDWWIRRNVLNQYGFSRDGKPVYPEYRDDFHCADVPLVPVAGLVVKADFDQGLRPAVVLRQTMPNGQLRILDELYCEGGAVELCGMLKRLMGSDRYAGIKVVGGRCDPAANARDATDAESWVDAVNRLMGWVGAARVRIADTNDPARRQAAVRHRLRTNVDDGRPGILISATCRTLRKGFNSHYRFKKQKGGGNDYTDSPDKVFPYADVHDALQYGALDDGGYEEIIGREHRKVRAMGNVPRQAKVEVRL